MCNEIDPIAIGSKASKSDEGTYGLKRITMKETVLKEALGIDVSKASLSMCLGSLTNDLSKDFEPREDVTNDNQGFRELSSWLKSAFSLAWCSRGESPPRKLLFKTLSVARFRITNSYLQPP